MTNVHFRPDDSGLQALKTDNTADRSVRAVSAPAATTAIQSVTDQPPAVSSGAHPPATYQGPERRTGERRKGQQRILLDTRSQRERRRQPRDQAGTDDVPKVGIDQYE
ncbi:MAG: hypothetical protein WCY26_05520 [Thiohalobacteraceae bacterium]